MILIVGGAVLLAIALILAVRAFRQGEVSTGPKGASPSSVVNVQKTKSEGLALFNRGRVKESVPKLVDYLKKEPDDAQARTTLALAYSALSKPERALSEYRAILKDHPKDGPTLYRLGLLMRQLDKPKDSVKYIEQAVAVDEKNPTFHAELAKAYAQEKEYGKALEEWNLVLKLTAPKDPYRAGIHGHIGDIYLRLGQPARAKSSYRAGLAFDPRNKYLRNQLARAGE